MLDTCSKEIDMTHIPATEVPGLRERFDQGYEMIPEAGCWIWVGYTDREGYGRIGIGKKTWKAHRVAWELYKGVVPTGLSVCHHCDVPACVNPSHLFVGTTKDNIQDCIAKGRHVRLFGERHTQAKLTSTQAVEIYSRRSEQASKLAEEYKIYVGGIRKIWRGEIWVRATGAQPMVRK